MKILEKQKTGNTVTLTVEVPEDRYMKAVDEELREASKHIHVPGFRKGKAPVDLVKRYVNDDVISERALRGMTANLYPDLIKEASLEPVDYPHVSLGETLQPGKPLQIKLAVDVYPEVKLGKYKGIKVTAPSQKVSDQDVELQINNYRDRQAQLVEVKDRAIQDADYAEMGIEAMLDGAAYSDLTQLSWAYQVGSNQLTVAFDKELVGVNLGEQKKFSVTFPDTFEEESLRTKTIEFSIIVKRVVERKLPAADAEFAKKVGPYETLEALQADIRKKMEETKKHESEDAVRNSLVDAVTEGAELTLPNGLVEREIDLMVNELTRSLENSQLRLPDYLAATKKTETQLRDELKGPATKRAKAKVVLRAIATSEKMEVTEADMTAEVEEIAKGSGGRSAAELKAALGPDGEDYIKDYLIRRKALDLVVEKAKIEG